MSIYQYITGMVGLLTACTSALDEHTTLVTNVQPLAVQVSTLPVAKGQITETYLPDGAELGLFIRNNAGASYDSQGLLPVKYTATGTDEAQTWTAELDQGIQLSATQGKAYAFYPYVATELTTLKVPITNDGTDWMYASEPANNLSNQNPQAQFTMGHAMTIIRWKLKKGDYHDPGVITSVSMSSSGLAKEANMDLEAANVTDYNQVGSEITAENVGTLNETPITIPLWAISTGEESTVSIQISADGNIYTATTPTMTYQQGKIYEYTLTLNSKVLDISAVSIQEWEILDQGTTAPGYTDIWDRALANYGVYAINSYGKPIPYAELTDETYSAVVFTVKGKAYQVAKSNLTANDSEDLYYWETGFFDINSLYNYYMLDENCDNGYLNGISTPQLSHNPDEWTYGSISDFNGAQNTANTIDAQKVDGVLPENTIGKAVMDYRKNEMINEGYTDWIVPSCGQLAFMYLMRNEIDDLLTMIGGTPLGSNTFWSSSEHNENVNWILNFQKGNVLGYRKYQTQRCRLIRVLNTN